MVQELSLEGIYYRRIQSNYIFDIIKTHRSITAGCIQIPYMLTPDVSTYGCPAVNQFEQISVDGHQMSLLEGQG